jgi:hypothetical protein
MTCILEIFSWNLGLDGPSRSFPQSLHANPVIQLKTGHITSKQSMLYITSKIKVTSLNNNQVMINLSCSQSYVLSNSWRILSFLLIITYTDYVSELQPRTGL